MSQKINVVLEVIQTAHTVGIDDRPLISAVQILGIDGLIHYIKLIKENADTVIATSKNLKNMGCKVDYHQTTRIQMWATMSIQALNSLT